MKADESSFKLIEFINPSGATVYRVTGWIGKKRIRQNFRTSELATVAKQGFEREAMNLAPLPSITTRLTDAQCREAERCFAKLDGKQFTLSQLVDYALWNYKPAAKSATVSVAVAQFIADKEAAGKRDLTVKTLTSRLKPLVAAHGAKLVSMLDADAVKPLIYRPNSGGLNRKSDYRALTNFFNWSVRQEFCAASPMSRIEKPIVEEVEPESLSVADCRRIMAAAASYRNGSWVPYFTLCLFGAIRPTEVKRLSWDAINLDAACVTISAQIAKRRSRRLVALAANTVAWLRPFALEKAAIIGPNFQRDTDEIKARAGFAANKDGICRSWTPDVLRHTGHIHAPFRAPKRRSDRALGRQFPGHYPPALQRTCPTRRRRRLLADRPGQRRQTPVVGHFEKHVENA